MRTVAALVAVSMLLGACKGEVNEWHNTTVFDPDQVDRAIATFYVVYKADATRYGRLTEANKREIARAISEKVAILNPKQYNDVLGHLAIDYRHHPDNRAAIEALLGMIYESVAPELQEDARRHPVRTVINDVFTVFSIGYAFGFGKGMYKWATRGRGFRSSFRFRRIARYVAVNMPRTRRAKLTALGLGTATGIAHAVIEATETRKLDPRDLLTAARSEGSDPSVLEMVIREMQELMALRRDQLNAKEPSDIQADPQFCLSQEERASIEPGQAPMGTMGCLDRIRDEIRSVKGQLRHIYERYPEFRASLETLAQDIRDTEARLDVLEPQLSPGEGLDPAGSGGLNLDELEGALE